MLSLDTTHWLCRKQHGCRKTSKRCVSVSHLLMVAAVVPALSVPVRVNGKKPQEVLDLAPK